jgi:hypothetical protein
MELYAELDAETADLQRACRACGSCCDFSRHEHVLCASSLERQVLGLAKRPESEGREEVCPYLEGGRCTARRERTLGCRTYFCDPAAERRGQELYERYLRRIAAIGREHGIAWDYRPVWEPVGPEPGLGPDRLPTNGPFGCANRESAFSATARRRSRFKPRLTGRG